MLEARALTKLYNHTPAVKDVSFTIRPGEILGYLGPNGAGIQDGRVPAPLRDPAIHGLNLMR